MIEPLSRKVLKDLDFIRELVEFELGYTVRGKERHPKLMMAQRLFINLIDLKYGIDKSSREKLVNRPQLAFYMGYDSYVSINHFLFNFNYFLNHYPELEEKWIILSNLLTDDSFPAVKYLQQGKQEMLSKVKSLDKKITKFKRDGEKKLKEESEKDCSESYANFW